MSTQGAIGVFDSGVGGISVLREIQACLPAESLLYFADSGHAPYGEKNQAFIQQRSLRIAEFLIGQGAKALVIACNTATAAAASVLRQRWPDMPIVGMEPAVKPAAAASRKRIVAVLATSGTLASARFAALLDSFSQGVQVITRPGVGLVDFIERGDLDSAALKACLAAHLQPLKESGADVLVLGCTHYVFLRHLIQAQMGPECTLVDTGAAVAAQLERQLAAGGALALADSQASRPSVSFFSSGDLQQVRASLLALCPELGANPVHYD